MKKTTPLKKFIFLYYGVSSFSLLCDPAFAQAPSAPSDAAGVESSSSALEGGNGDIVVTAQRQRQNLKDVPIAITALAPTTLEHLSIRTIDNIQSVTPGMVFETGYSYPQIYIRGVGVATPSPGLEGPVALYVDGVYVPRGLGILFDLVDMNSIEVLKGPQGTLYGRNATGGAILLNTANPTQKTEMKGSFEYGRFNHLMGETVVNMPVSDTLAFRLAGRYTDDPGYIKDIFTNERIARKHSYTLRGKLKWDPSSDFSAIFALEYGHGEGYQESFGRNSSTGALCLPCTLGGTTAAGPYEITEDFKRHDSNRSFGVNLQLQYDTGALTIKSVTAYRNISSSLGDDPDHSSIPLFNYLSTFGGKTFSQDVQISSKLDGMFNFLVGGQYIHDNASTYSQLFGDIFGVPTNSPVLPTAQSNPVTNSYAVFAEAYIKPIDRLTITLGGRFSSDHRRIDTTLNPLGLSIFNPGGPAAFGQKVTYSKFTPRAVVAYSMDTVSLYASFSRGYKAGGFNTPAFAPQTIPIRPETMDSFELGAKFVTPDRRGRLNIAAFHYNYKDLQVSRVLASGAGQAIQNAATARGNGVEFDASYKLTDWFELSAGGAYLDAKYGTYIGAPVVNAAFDAAGNPTGFVAGVADISGSRLPRAPKFTANVSANLEVPLGADWRGRLSGVANYSSNYAFDPVAGGNLGQDYQKKYLIMDLSGGVGPSSHAYEIGFYVENATNHKYYNLISTTSYGVIQYIAKPRTYGVRLKFEMGS